MTRTTPTVTSRYGSSVAGCWVQSGVFTRSLSSFTSDKRDAADAAGFRAVAVQLDNCADASANRAELAAMRPELARRHWTAVGWATAGQGTDPRADGITQRAIAEQLDLPWIVNIEAWGEGVAREATRLWMSGWLINHVGTRPVMLSCLSSVTANYARDMDFSPFVGYPLAAISPQVYCASNPLYTLPAMRGSFAKAPVPRDRIMPTCNVVKGQIVPPRYRNWRGPR